MSKAGRGPDPSGDTRAPSNSGVDGTFTVNVSAPECTPTSEKSVLSLAYGSAGPTSASSSNSNKLDVPVAEDRGGACVLHTWVATIHLESNPPSASTSAS